MATAQKSDKATYTIVQKGTQIAFKHNAVDAVTQAKALAQSSNEDVSVILHAPDIEDREVVFHPDGSNDKIWYIDKGQYIRPVVGQVYTNRGGGQYRCIRENDDGALFYNAAGGYSKTSGVFQNMESGWTIIAKGIIQFIDGTIEWSHSVDGHFEDLVPDKEGEHQ